MAHSGDYAWMMASAALVFMMVPGIALFYSGLRSQSTALSIIWLNMMSVSIVSIQWYLFGYSLVFSPTSSSHFIGDVNNAVFLRTTGDHDYAGVRAPETPAMVFGLFQGMFAAFTMALVTGVIAEKGRLVPFVILSVFWTSLVYDPIAYWLWNANGWANRLGALDWAGGTPVHICSGAASLAYTLMLKYIRVTTKGSPNIRKKDYSGSGLESHNMTNALLGTMLVWFGWFGFNAGSELLANVRAASTFIASNLAACSGGVAYTLYQQVVGEKWSGIGFCTGAFAGLVAITPGAGYVPAWAGLVFGPTASLVCFLLLSSEWLEDLLEEPLDISIIHGAGGLWGMFMTGIFADKAVAALDGSIIDGGVINRNARQIGVQLAGGIGGFAYSFFMTLVLLIIIHKLSSFFPSLKLRAKGKGIGHIRLDKEELGDTEAYRITSFRHRTSARSPPQTANEQDREDSTEIEYIEMDTEVGGRRSVQPHANEAVNGMDIGRRDL